MNRAEAFECLGVAPSATTGEIRRRYKERYSDLEIRLTHAPTPQVRQAYERQQQDLKAACMLLGHGIPEDVDDRLPSTEPVAIVLPITPPSVAAASVATVKPRRHRVRTVVLSLAFLLAASIVLGRKPASSNVATASKPGATAPAGPLGPPAAAGASATLHRYDFAHEHDRAHRYDTVQQDVETSAPTEIREHVPAHPEGDLESETVTLHDFDVTHVPASVESDGAMHPDGCTQQQLPCQHVVDRCPHGVPNRCIRCGQGPWLLHPYDIIVTCPHAQPCQHRSNCMHQDTRSRRVPCTHWETRTRQVGDTRTERRSRRVDCTHFVPCRHQVPCTHRTES